MQSYLRINPNTPANNDTLKTVHNQMMYEWSARQTNLLLITGHTISRCLSPDAYGTAFPRCRRSETANNQTALSAIEAQLELLHLAEGTAVNLKKYKPVYFNSGCCCFDDGDITGIEIAEGMIR